MNRFEFYRAIQTVKWSDEKRKKIEQKLKQPRDKSIVELENMTDEDFEYGFIMTEAMIRRSEERMKKETRRIRLSWIAFAAVMLITGGTAAGVAAWGRNHGITSNSEQEVHIRDVTVRLTSQSAPRYQSGINYTYNITGGFSESEDGWFWNSYHSSPTGSSSYALTYTDKETGESAVVCAKPNCLHDGNLFCTASTNAYHERSSVVWYDGYLYATANKITDQNVLNAASDEQKYWQALSQMDADKNRQVLLRYSPDGSEVTELADFGSGSGTLTPVIHRGYVWCIVQLQSFGEEYENPITHKVQKLQSGGWQLWGYEIATGERFMLCESMSKPEVNHINDSPSLFAWGDNLYLYHDPNKADWDSPSGTERISLLTGEREVVISSEYNINCMSDGWFYIVNYHFRSDGGVKTKYYRFDPETGEQYELGNHNYSQYVWEGFDINSEQQDLKETEEEIDGRTVKVSEAQNVLIIRDPDGNILKEVKLPLPYKDIHDQNNYDMLYYSNCYLVGQIEDKIYIQVTLTSSDMSDDEEREEYMYLTVDELMSSDGEPEWHLAVDTHCFERKEAE